MKIKIPEDIKIVYEGNEVGDINFLQFVRYVSNDSRANNSGKNIKSSMRFENILTNAKPGDEVEILEDDFLLMGLIVEEPEPEIGYPSIVINTDGKISSRSIGRQLLPFIEVFQK